MIFDMWTASHPGCSCVLRRIDPLQPWSGWSGRKTTGVNEKGKKQFEMMNMNLIMIEHSIMCYILHKCCFKYIWKFFACLRLIKCAQDWDWSFSLTMLKGIFRTVFLKECCVVVVPGSCGNISDGSSRSSSYGTDERNPPTLSRPDFPHGTPVTHACLNLNLKPNGQLESSSSEDLPVGSSHSTPSPTLYAKPTNRNEARPPPPPYRHSRLTPSVVSSSPVVSQSQHSQQHGKTGNQNSSSPAGTLLPTSPEWQDWQRDRWHIWQLLSSDNADTLPETLVWCQMMLNDSVCYTKATALRVLCTDWFWG